MVSKMPMKRHLTSFTGQKLKSLASWLPVRVVNYKITTLSTALSQKRFCKLLKCHSSCAVTFSLTSFGAR